MHRRFTAHNLTARAASLLLAAALCTASLSASAGHTGGGGSSRDRAHGYLGIEFHDTSEDQIAALHLQGPHGAEVSMVDHDGPAGQAGLQPHDIVLQIDGQNIESSEDLSRRIRESLPGRIITLSILRLGHAITATAKLANREELERKAYHEHLAAPSPPSHDDGVDNILVERYTVVEPAPSQHTAPHGNSFIGTVLHTAPYTGASLDTMPPQLAGYFGAPPKTGLLVQDVAAGSPAAAAGLRAGDVVLRIDAAPIKSTSDWSKRLRAAKGNALSLTILRERHEMTISLQPDAKRHSLLEFPQQMFSDSGAPPSMN